MLDYKDEIENIMGLFWSPHTSHSHDAVRWKYICSILANWPALINAMGYRSILYTIVYALLYINVYIRLHRACNAVQLLDDGVMRVMITLFMVYNGNRQYLIAVYKNNE